MSDTLTRTDDAFARSLRERVDAAAPRPDRPVTPYEAIGIAAGRPITDVVATRIGSAGRHPI